MRLTKQYPSGFITLEAGIFKRSQESVDSEIRNSEPLMAAIGKLFDYENREECGCTYCDTHVCGNCESFEMNIDMEGGRCNAMPYNDACINYVPVKFCKKCVRKLV